MKSDMGSPPSVTATQHAKAGRRAKDVITANAQSQAGIAAAAEAGTKTTLLVDVHSPFQQSLSWYLESSESPTPSLTSSTNSSLTSFFCSGNQSALAESFEESRLVTPSALHMAEDIDPSATKPDTRERAQSSNSSHSCSPFVFSEDEEVYPSPFRTPISTIDILDGLDQEYDLEEGLFGDSKSIPIPRVQENQIPLDTPLSTSFSSKLSHFPAFAKKWKHIKDAAINVTTQPEPRQSTTRSYSSNDVREDTIISPLFMPKHISYTEMNSPVSPLDLNLFWNDHIPDPIDRTRFTSTPLLPPNLHSFDEGEESDARIYTPPLSYAVGSSRALSIASETNSESSGQCISYSERIYPISSISRRNTHSSEAPDISGPPVKKQDEWTSKLGHFNFTIEPEPYLPEDFTASAYEKLLSDWEIARAEYCKHQARTLEHYGPNSKAFKLTEEKWNCIDAKWQKNSKQVREKALSNGEWLPEQKEETATRNVVMEIAGIMSSVNIPYLDGKFPKLGDADIVGPMAMDPPRTASSRAVSPTRGLQQGWKLAKFFGRVLND